MTRSVTKSPNRDNYSKCHGHLVPSLAARMNLKKLRLGVQFEMLPEGRALSENDSALKAMKEAARQLGLTLGSRNDAHGPSSNAVNDF